MKYDFELDFVNNNSLTWIMDQIKTGTTVLEFGPATGRLTKYMKEDLGCKVYLAEIDEESGKKALQYAEDLVVGDVENYEWLERYKDLRFDHIIFADVLEHLRNPEEILVQAKRLLKVDGSILLSVPNVAHNSVLINLLNNRFEYTSVGLLDNTHIHLFTKESLENMLVRAGLFVEQRYATYSKVGTNEIVNSLNDVAGIDKSYWLSREYGEVYQFVYAVRKSQEYVINEANLLPRQNRNYFAQIFYDSKNPNEEMAEKRYLTSLQGIQSFVFEAEKAETLFRFDPLNAECFIKVQVQGAEVISYNACIKRDEVYLFNTDDPIIELQKNADNTSNQIVIQIEYISIDAKVVNEFSKALLLARENESTINTEMITQVNELRNSCAGLQEQVALLNNHNEQLSQEKGRLDVENANLSQEKEQLRLVKEQLSQEKEQLHLVKEQLSQEKEQLTQEKERLHLMNEQINEEKTQLINANAQLNETITIWSNLCHEKDRVLDDIYHSKKWRLINIFRKR